MVEIVPTYGQVKLLDSSRTNGSATFNQRGIGARFEHGFMAEPAGIQHYLQTLSQMANSVIETQKFLILHELFMTNEQQINDLSCNRYQGKI